MPADEGAAPEEHGSVSSMPTASERALQANVDASLEVLVAALGHLEDMVVVVQGLKAKVEAKDEEVKVPLQNDVLVERVARDEIHTEIHTLKTEEAHAGDQGQRARPVRLGAAPKPAFTGECAPRGELKRVSAGGWQAVALLPSSPHHVTCVRKRQQQSAQRTSQSTQPALNHAQLALYHSQPAVYHRSTVSGNSASKEEVVQENMEEDAMVKLVLAAEAGKEQIAQENENVEEEDAMIELVLDMQFAEIVDLEDDFKSQVAMDVARALGGDVNKVHIVKMEAGSIFLQIRLASGICIYMYFKYVCMCATWYQVHTHTHTHTLSLSLSLSFSLSHTHTASGVCDRVQSPWQAAQELKRQAGEETSLLKQGKRTSKTKRLHVVPPTLPPKHSEVHDETAPGREKPPPLSLSPSLREAPPPSSLSVSMHGGARVKELEDEVAKKSSTDMIDTLSKQLMELEAPPCGGHQAALKRSLVDAEGEMEALQLKVRGYDAAQQLLATDAWQQLQCVVQEIRLVHQMCVCAKEDCESAADQEGEREMARVNELQILEAEKQLAQKVSLMCG